jgi:hypothetical protein
VQFGERVDLLEVMPEGPVDDREDTIVVPALSIARS